MVILILLLAYIIGVALNMRSIYIMEIEDDGVTIGTIVSLIFGFIVPYSLFFIYQIVVDPYKIGDKIDKIMDKN